MTTRREYAERIADAWNGAREAVFEAGRELLSAKAELPHGQFGAMIEHDLPFGPRHAQRLMAIAADPRLTNATHASLLPTAPTTLYELSRLDDATFAAAIEAKAINPEMERKDASRLRAAPRRAARLGAIESKAARCVPLSELGREGRRYAVILADPAWTHDVRSDKGKEKSPENHYPVMTTEDIMALPVRALAADDCVLFLWTTAPHDCRGDSRAVIKAWGFDTVVSQFVWRKTNGDGTPHRGTGYWNQSCHEIVLIATKGKVAAPLQQDLPLSVIDAPVAAHSEKPAVFRALIERYFPDVVRLEMNARLTPERCAEIGGSGLNDGRAGFFMGDDGWHYWAIADKVSITPKDLSTFDVIIEATGSKEALEHILRDTKSDATILLLGFPYGETLYNFEDVVGKEKHIIGSVGADREDFVQALQLLPTLHIEPFVQTIFPLHEFKKAWELHASGKHLKVILKP